MTQQEFDTMLNIELGSASAVMNKRARLNTSLGSKRNRLYGLEENNFASLDNSVTNINGQQFSNSNKVWNSDTAAQKQQKMSDVVDQQIYKRDDGSMYQIDPYSGSEVDFVGDTRRFYMYGTKTSDDEIKAGLAKSGFGTSDIRYDRTLAESLGASRGKGYGWESGPEGVDINKKQLDILLPFSTATEYEGYLHGNTDAIGNRTVLRDNQAGRDARGSGSSEYYSDVVGLLGDTSRDYNADTNYSDFRGQLGGKEMSRGDKLNLAIDKAKMEKDGVLDSVLRAPLAAVSGLARGIYDVADTTVEAAGNIASRGASLYGDEEAASFLDRADIATDKEKNRQINSTIGYDDMYSRKIMEASGHKYDEAMKDVDLFSPSTWENIDIGSLYDSVKIALSTPETAGYSLGYLVPALYGVFEKGAIKFLSESGQKSAATVQNIAKGNVFNSSGKAMSKSEKASAIKDVTMKMSTSDRTKMFLADHADALGYGAMMTNDQLEEVIAKNGGDQASLWKIGTMVALNAGGMKLDMGSVRAIKNGSGLTDHITDAMSKVGKSASAKVMSSAVAYSAKLAAAGITEMPQEYIQSYIEAFNKLYGTNKKGSDEKVGALEAALSEEVRTEAGKASIAGLAGGIHMKAGFSSTSIPSSIKSVVSASMEAREEANSKKHGQTFESIDDAKNKIVVGNEIISQNDVTISELTSNINTISGSETVEDLQTAVEESDISDGTKQGILGEIERGIDAELDVNEMKGRINSLVDSHIKQLESDSKHKKLAIESAEEALRTTESDDPVKSDDVVKLEQEISTQESIIRDNETVASETEATQEMIDAHKVDSDKLSAMNTELKELNVQSIKDEVASKIEVEKSKVSAEKKGIVNRILSKIDGKISKGKRSAVAKLESVLKTMDDAALDVLLDGKDGVDSIVTQFGEKANINASDVLKSINALRDLRKKSSAKFGISNKDEKIKLSSTGVKELDAEIDILNVQSQAMDELIKKSVNMKKEDIKKVKDEIYQNMSNSIVAMTQSIGRMTEQEINDFSVEEYIKSIPTIRDVDGTESKKMVTAKGFITGAYEAQVLVHKANKKTSESDAGRRRQVIKIATAKTVNTQSEIDKARANIVVLEEKGKLDSDAVARLKKMLDKVEKRSQVKLKEDKTKAAEKTEEVTEEVIEDINEQIDNDDSLTMAEKEMTKAIAMDNVKGQMAAGVEISPESIESIEWYNIKIDEAKDGKITIEHKCPGE